MSSSSKAAAAAAAEAEAEADDPDFHFRREVAETFLRCALLDCEEDLAAIELNSLKIAEDKAFADVAEAEINPLLVKRDGEGVVAVDGLVALR